MVTEGVIKITGAQRRSVGIFLLSLILLVSSCGKRQLPHDTAWSPAQSFPSSFQMRLAELNGKPTCIDGNDYYFLEADGSNWTKRTFPSPVNVPDSLPQTDPASSRFILHDGGNVRDAQLEAHIVCCSLNPNSGISTIFDRRLILNEDELLGSNRTPTCEIAVPPMWKQFGPPKVRPEEGRLGGSIVLSNEVYIAYSIGCGTSYGSNGVSSTGPNQSGLLCGTVDGPHWTKQKLLDIDTHWHDVFATTENLYFLAGTGRGLEKNLKRGLRSVRISRSNKTQSTVEIVAPHFYSDSCTYAAVADGDTIHLAWLDTRNERDHPIRSMLTDTPSLEGNLELYYRRRRDSDSAWTKEVLLSKGIDFSFDPAMAVEGKHLVVVWSGYERDEKRSVPRLHRSDIFFATSSDGGNTWKGPVEVTDNKNPELAITRSQVALHRGMIHLFYEAESLTYQRRPFPED